MNFDHVKAMMKEAVTATQRQQAIESAIESGMKLHEIEQYLDWIDSVNGFTIKPDDVNETPNGSNPDSSSD